MVSLTKKKLVKSMVKNGHNHHMARFLSTMIEYEYIFSLSNNSNIVDEFMKKIILNCTIHYHSTIFSASNIVGL